MATDARSELVLQAALEYAGYGWRVVRVYGLNSGGECTCREGRNCTSAGKHPIGTGWQKLASSDEAKLARWFENENDLNLGIKMGQDSGIIDIECDSPEAEQTLLILFDGEFPVTPTFQASRGKHRIFKHNQLVPHGDKGVFKWGGRPDPAKPGSIIHAVEFRTGSGDLAAQSVFPPSRHRSGKEYRWLVHPSECEIAELSPLILARLNNTNADELLEHKTSARPPEHWERIAKGVSEGSRNEDAASYIGRLLADLKNPFDADAVGRIWSLVQIWNSQNQPALSQDELTKVFRSILQRHRNQRTNETLGSKINSERPFDIGSDGAVPKWKVVIVESKPRSYRLYSPLWSLKSPTGYIKLTSAQYRSAEAIEVQAIEQADVWVPGSFSKLWRGDKESRALGADLIESAEYLPATVDSKRDLVVAEMLYEKLLAANSKLVDEDKDPTAFRGVPCRIENDESLQGAFAFSFKRMFEDMAKSDFKVKERELSEVLDEVGALDKQFGPRGARKRFKVVDREAFAKLLGVLGLNQEKAS